MTKTIELKIVTPEKLLLSEEVDWVTIPTMEGEITVLPNHLPVITAMKPGELKIKKKGAESYFSVMKGVAEIDGKTITILTDAAERAEEIDSERAEQAKKKAQELMSQTRRTEESYADVVAQMERALSRAKIAQRRKARGRSTYQE